jgi:hypothetical protein
MLELGFNYIYIYIKIGYELLIELLNSYNR